MTTAGSFWSTPSLCERETLSTRRISCFVVVHLAGPVCGLRESGVGLRESSKKMENQRWRNCAAILALERRHVCRLILDIVLGGL